MMARQKILLSFPSTGYIQWNDSSGTFGKIMVAGDGSVASPATIIMRKMHLRYVYSGVPVDDNIKKQSDEGNDFSIFWINTMAMAYVGNTALPVISNQKMNKYLKDLCELCGFNTMITKVCFRKGQRVEETYPKYQLIGTHADRRHDICKDMSVQRKTSAKYLNMIVETGLLDKIKIGKENFYVNKKLFELFINQAGGQASKEAGTVITE